MNLLPTIIDFLFESLIGVLFIVGILSAIYRQLTRTNTSGRSMMESISQTVGDFDAAQRKRRNTEGALGSTDEVIQVGSTSLNPNIPSENRTFTERDMYITKIEEVMTYSATKGEPYANPKELLDAGLLTMREYREMISRN